MGLQGSMPWKPLVESKSRRPLAVHVVDLDAVDSFSTVVFMVLVTAVYAGFGWLVQCMPHSCQWTAGHVVEGSGDRKAQASPFLLSFLFSLLDMVGWLAYM